MRRPCFQALCIGFVLLTLSACDRGRGAKAPGKGLDHETMAAYQKLGGVYGEWGKEGAAMPGFTFRTFPKAKLPQVTVPFVLDLSHSDVTDAGLKDLAGLNNLAELHLEDTKVTPAGLSELSRALPNCRIHR
jgi:hypothetical protein